MNIYGLTAFVVFVSVAASSKHYNPCKNVKHGDPNYLKEDPRDCSKFYMSHGQTPHHKDCPDGTSFDPNMNIGHGGGVIFQIQVRFRTAILMMMMAMMMMMMMMMMTLTMVLMLIKKEHLVNGLNGPNVQQLVTKENNNA